MRSTVRFLTALIFLALASRADAQFETATVVGTARDSSGAVVADARVTLTNVETGVAQERTSDASGSYEFFNVRIGRYVVTADKAGFSVALVDNVQVTVGARLRVDVEMAVGQLTEKVEVRASATQLQTDSPRSTWRMPAARIATAGRRGTSSAARISTPPASSNRPTARSRASTAISSAA